MHPITRILCPVDLSPASNLALDYAERLARACGARLVIVHAFETPASYNVEGQTRPADPELSRQFEEFSRVENLEVERVLHAGEPGDVICWVAMDRHCDLIVMGTHGRTGLLHLLMGSVAESVVRHARCPVLTIRDQKGNEPAPIEPLVIPLPAPRYM